MATVSKAAQDAATNIAFSLNDLINVAPEGRLAQQSLDLAVLFRDACFAVGAKEEAGRFAELVEIFAQQVKPAAPPQPAVGRQPFRPGGKPEMLELVTPDAEVAVHPLDLRGPAGDAKINTSDPEMINVIVQNMRPQLEKQAEERFQQLVKQHGLRPADPVQAKCAR